MSKRLTLILAVWLIIGWMLICATVAWPATARSANFVVTTSDLPTSQRIAAAAEGFRRDLAVMWLGRELPGRWSSPCVIRCRIGPHLGAGGNTTFAFSGGEVFGWQADWQGSEARLLDSVLPHEITHMILASHFRRPLPRWADEGAATCVEAGGELEKHHRMIAQFLRTGRGIAFSRMFAMTEYPRDVMPLYAHGATLAELLIRTNGPRQFVIFLEAGMTTGDWPGALGRYYGFGGDLGQLQEGWLAWIASGFPDPTAYLAGYAGEANRKCRWVKQGNQWVMICEGESGAATAGQVPPASLPGWQGSTADLTVPAPCGPAGSVAAVPLPPPLLAAVPPPLPAPPTPVPAAGTLAEVIGRLQRIEDKLDQPVLAKIDGTSLKKGLTELQGQLDGRLSAVLKVQTDQRQLAQAHGKLLNKIGDALPVVVPAVTEAVKAAMPAAATTPGTAVLVTFLTSLGIGTGGAGIVAYFAARALRLGVQRLAAAHKEGRTPDPTPMPVCEPPGDDVRKRDQMALDLAAARQRIADLEREVRETCQRFTTVAVDDWPQAYQEAAGRTARTFPDSVTALTHLENTAKAIHHGRQTARKLAPD